MLVDLVDCQLSPNYSSRNLILENMYEVIPVDIRFLKICMSLSVIDLGDLLKLDSRNSNFPNCICRKHCLNG